jgi:CheY-like chemotaxis protein
MPFGGSRFTKVRSALSQWLGRGTRLSVGDRVRSISRTMNDMTDEAVPLVLVVDDDPTVLEGAARFLEKRGFEVVTASSPFEVPRMAFLRKPSVVVLDITMPGLGGEEVSNFLRRTPQIDEIPIVFFSSVDEVRLRRISLQLRDASYALKTGGFRPLYEAICRILGRSV